MRRSFFSVFVSLVFVLSSFAHAEGFSYQSPVGADWCRLAPVNAPCCEGKQQSPIDIITTAAKYDADLPKLDLDYSGVCALELVHNGHTIQANVPAGAGKLEIGDKVYGLVQFHFHAPSEHTLDGKHYPVEMHLVHKSADGALAVLGVFIDDTQSYCTVTPVRDTLQWTFSREAAAYRERSELWDALPMVPEVKTTLENFRLKSLLPKGKATYRYSGSLTTPPCSEGVAWHALAQPIAMNRTQIDKMETLFSGEHFPMGNARPAQSLQGREVLTDVKRGTSRSAAQAF